MSRVTVLYAAALVLPLLLLSAASPPPRGLSRDYLAERSALLETLPSHRSEIGPKAFVVARHGDEFIVTSLTGAASQQKPPTDSRYESVYWLLHDAPPQTLDASAVVLRTSGDGRYTGLLKDESLRVRLSGMNASERRRLFAPNPHLRLAFATDAETQRP